MKVLAVFGSILLAVVLIAGGVFGGWFNTCFFNRVDYIDQKIDDATRYETIKKVEDSCRAMISSYESDRLVYEQYRDSDNEEKQSWSEQAKMRANKTAATYNNYVLENNFVWSGNVPDDIRRELAYLE